MKTAQQEIDERTNLTSSNKFELLLFRLGADSALGQSELFGINVFKIREIVAMPAITPIVGASPHSLGVVNLRGQVIPVLDLPSIVGCTPKTGLNIMLVTEFARTTQAFAVESVEDIARLDWNQVMSAESSGSAGNSLPALRDWTATPTTRAWRRYSMSKPFCKWSRRPMSTRWTRRKWAPGSCSNPAPSCWRPTIPLSRARSSSRSSRCCRRPTK